MKIEVDPGLCSEGAIFILKAIPNPRFHSPRIATRLNFEGNCFQRSCFSNLIKFDVAGTSV